LPFRSNIINLSFQNGTKHEPQPDTLLLTADANGTKVKIELDLCLVSI